MFASRPYAHEIPARVTVLAFIKPDGDRLTLLLRVPLESMRDVNFPLRPAPATADSGTGALDIERAEPLMGNAAQQWIAGYLQLFENGRALDSIAVVATRISLPSDRSFESFESALRHVRAPPLPPGTDLPWRQAMLDVLLEVPITSDRSRFSIRSALAHLGLRTNTVLRFLPAGAGGGERAFQYTGDPGVIELDPRWHQAVVRFVRLGFLHILDGIDHLLFVLCLVIPFRRIRPLIAIVTAFTVAHSITLGMSAMGFAPDALWFPPLIEMLIAMSIVYMAIENIVGAKLDRRWMVAFAFGLVHGFGFSFALRETMQFAGSHLAFSLLAFNVGVELGQILVLILAIPVLDLLFRRVVSERIGTIILSAIIAHSAWHWMADRWSAFREYTVIIPAMDAFFLASVLRVLLALALIVAIGWSVRRLFGARVFERGIATSAGSGKRDEEGGRGSGRG